MLTPTTPRRDRARHTDATAFSTTTTWRSAKRADQPRYQGGGRVVGGSPRPPVAQHQHVVGEPQADVTLHRGEGVHRYVEADLVCSCRRAADSYGEHGTLRPPSVPVTRRTLPDRRDERGHRHLGQESAGQGQRGDVGIVHHGQGVRSSGRPFGVLGCRPPAARIRITRRPAHWDQVESAVRARGAWWSGDQHVGGDQSGDRRRHSPGGECDFVVAPPPGATQHGDPARQPIVSHRPAVQPSVVPLARPARCRRRWRLECG